MSGHLREEQLETLRAALHEMRERLLARGGLREDDGQPEPLDLQEQAADEMAERGRLAVNGLDRRRLAEVQGALARIAEGSYGECEESGEPIPFARLLAEPTVRYTVESQEIVEAEDARERTRARAPDDAGY